MSTLSSDLPACPYVGLVPFKESDYPYFFGRSRDIEVISSNLSAARLTVLYGPTGVGKSSVLQAGVVRRLRVISEREQIVGEAGYVLVTFSNWSENSLADAIKAVVRKNARARRDVPSQEPAEALSLAQTFKKWSEILQCDILLILDQFEEFFLYHEHRASEIGSFVEQLPELINSPDCRTHCLISLREDSLAKLDIFKGQIRYLLENRLRLDLMEENQARDAIIEPVKEYWRRAMGACGEEVVERQLVDDVVKQLLDLEEHAGLTALGSGRVVEQRGTEKRVQHIETPFLQLVMSRVWDQALRDKTGLQKDGSACLATAPADEMFVLYARYLEQLGGVRRIIDNHLDHVLAGLQSHERRLCERLFRFLVTPSGSKIALSLGDLHSFTNRRALTARRSERLRRVLNTLCEKRILRHVPRLGRSDARYEIFHDILGAAASAWRKRRRLRRRVGTLVGVAGIITLVLTCGIIYSTIQTRLEREAAEEQRQLVEAYKRRDAAQARLDKAGSALKDALVSESPRRETTLHDVDPGGESGKDARAFLVTYLAEIDQVIPVIGADGYAMRTLASDLLRLGDVARKSKIDGASEIAFDLFGKIIALEKVLGETPVSTSFRTVASIAHERLGDILYDRGEITEAKGHFEMSLSIDSSSSTMSRNLALDHRRLGRLALGEGDLIHAKEHIIQYVSISQGLLNSEANRDDAERNLADAYEWLADICMREDDLVAARANLLAEDEIIGRLYRKSPNDEKTKLAYGFAKLWLGSFRLDSGEVDSARQDHEQALTIFRAFAKDPTDKISEDNLAYACRALGTTLMVKGEVAEARRLISESVERFGRLAGRVDGAKAQESLAISLGHLSDVCLRLKDLSAARTAADQKLELAGKWKESQNPSARNIYRWALLGKARVAVAERDLTNALRWCSEALAVPTGGPGANVSSSAFRKDYAVSVGTMSKIRMLEKRFDTARELAIEAGNLVPNEKWPQVLLAHSLLLSGKEGEARVLYEKTSNGVAYSYQYQKISDMIIFDFADFRRFGVESAAMDQIARDLVR